jgi:NADH:ubiquinone oxidoreductase subunit F (NADH-binding)
MSRNLRGLSERKGLDDSLLKEIVAAGSDQTGDRDFLLKGISGKYLIGKSSVLGTNSFYHFLQSEHTDKKVFVCNGTACLTSGRQGKLREALLEGFREDEIGTVTCLGHCHSNQAFMYNHRTYSLTDMKLSDIDLKSDGFMNTSVHTGTNVSKPALLGKIDDLEAYYGILREFEGNLSGALKQIEISKLRGRGGAGFPFFVKLKSAADAVSLQKYVVCNADEGDPGAFSDKWLLEERPHSVLFGMLIAGLITGADTGIIYIRGEYPESINSVRQAIEQIERENIIKNILSGKEPGFKFYIGEGAGAYICGEETSLLNSLEGLRPEVRTRPPFPAQYGLFGKPTVISNVETFANIRYILKEGGEAYAALGTRNSTGTKLVSLDGAFQKPGVYEVRMGTPLRSVLNEMGGGTRYPVKAYQIGGPLGGVIPHSMIGDLDLDFESLNEAGFLLGHAGIVSIPYDFPMIKLLLHLFEFTSAESCGKCVPCRIGADRGFAILKQAVYNEEKIDEELFTDLLETMQLGSLCALGGGVPLPVKNILHHFDNELEEYFKQT